MIEKIAQKIESMSGTYAGYDIFSDWVKALAISISNSTDMIHGKIWQEREDQYMDIARKYGSKTMGEFSELSEMLIEALDQEIQDVLGAVFMAENLGAKSTGQFFTPFHVSLLTAATSIPKEVSEEKPMVIHEPSTGAGGMIIAVAKILLQRGVNPQRCMRVEKSELRAWWKNPENIREGHSSTGSIEAIMRKIAKRAGVEKANPHKYRRTCATMALRRGMPLMQVSKMLGHENVSTTQIYLDLSEDELEQAHKKYVI